MGLFSDIVGVGIKGLLDLGEKGVNRLIGVSNSRFADRLNYNHQLWEAQTLGPSAYKSMLDQQSASYPVEKILNHNRTFVSVADMRGALEQSGYNPLLAVDGGGIGGSAATPPLIGGSHSSASFAGNGANGNNDPFAVSSAKAELDNKRREGKILDATLKQLGARTDEINANTARTRRETELMGYSNMWNAAHSLFQDAKAPAKKAYNAVLKAAQNSASELKAVSDGVRRELNSDYDGQKDSKLDDLKREGFMLHMLNK